MKKTEVECCDVTYVHDEAVMTVRGKMPDEELLKELADFYKVFGDSTRIKILCVLLESEMCVCDLPSITGAEADEACEEPKGREDRILFAGRRAYPDDHQSGDGAYYRMIFI